MNPRQFADQRIQDSIGEILLLAIAREILERQDGNRSDAALHLLAGCGKPPESREKHHNKRGAEHGGYGGYPVPLQKLKAAVQQPVAMRPDRKAFKKASD